MLDFDMAVASLDEMGFVKDGAIVNPAPELRCFCGGRFSEVWADDATWQMCGSCGMDLDTCRAEFG